LRSLPKFFLGPRFAGEGIPQILDMLFQIAVTSEHVADFGRVLFSELGDWAEKKKNQGLVKFKSLDNYVGRPKKYSIIIKKNITRPTLHLHKTV